MFFFAKLYCIYVTSFDMIDLVLLLKYAQFTDMWKAERINVYMISEYIVNYRNWYQIWQFTHMLNMYRACQCFSSMFPTTDF